MRGKPCVEHPKAQKAHGQCAECKRRTNAAWIQRNRTKQRNLNRLGHLKRLYNLTEEGYTALSISQGGLCAICAKPPTNKRLAVDHDHKSMKIRGLLCENCNKGLGLFEDNASRLTKALEYLSQQSE